MKTLKTAIVFQMMLAVGIVLTMANTTWAAPIPVVTAYVSLDEEHANYIIPYFEKKHGIKINWVRLATGESVARMEAERNNPQASIWVGGVGLGHIEAKNKGLTMPYASSYAKNIPNNFKDGNWTGMYVGYLCFESNEKSLKKYNLTAPTSWKEICEPKYKGHVQMANPGSSGTAYNVLATLVQIYGEDQAFELLKKLDANITQYTKSGSAPGKNAALGEITIAIGYSHDATKLIDEGYPLLITYPSEGTGYEVASVSLIKNGPAKELEHAKKLYDFMISEECKKLFVDLKINADFSTVKTINQDDQWAAREKQRLVEKWNAVISGGAKTK